jgi:hypothetical protein
MKKRTIACIVALMSVIAIVLILVAWKYWLTIPHPPQYKQGAGAVYAEKLALRTQRLSIVLYVIGWILVTLAGLLATAGAVLGSKPLTDDKSITVLKSQRGVICTVLAVVVGGIGWQCMDRSSSATKTASIATAAIATATIADVNDIKAYNACIQAKSAWLEGRMNDDRLQTIEKNLKSK